MMFFGERAWGFGKAERGGAQKRTIWRPGAFRSKLDIERKRQEFGLSGTEAYQRLKGTSGRELVESDLVQNLLSYSADWSSFIVGEERPELYGSPSIFPNNKTGELLLPHPFVIPSRKSESNQWGNALFYWDIYFINKALLASGREDYLQLAIHHVENFQYLFDRLGYIPNASSLRMINRTQTPFLTGMIMDIYSVTKDKGWLAEKMAFAKREYEDVWMYTEEEGKRRGIAMPSHRISEDSLLLRPCGTDIVAEPYGAAANSGLDNSAEWARRAYETSPILLNGAMYKYEIEFAKAAEELGNGEEAAFWKERAVKRAAEINTRHWDEKKGMYFNLQYNRENGQWERDDTYYGLITFMPLWLNIATPHQAERVMRNLSRFESLYGLFVAAKDSVVDQATIRRINRRAYRKYPRYIPALDDVFKPEQWDYPNIWSNFEYFAIEGMLNYQKIPDAKKVMEHILRASAAFFQSKGTLSEKRSGLSGFNGGSFHYGDQEGFGWTKVLALICAGRISDITNGRYGTIAS